MGATYVGELHRYGSYIGRGATSVWELLIVFWMWRSCPAELCFTSHFTKIAVEMKAWDNHMS